MTSKDINRVALVGAGNQGSKIAFRCALSGLRARLSDVKPQILESAGGAIDGWTKEYLAKGLLTPTEAAAVKNRIEFSPDLAHCLAGADLIIEAVPEIVEIKRQVMAEINRLAPPRPSSPPTLHRCPPRSSPMSSAGRPGCST